MSQLHALALKRIAHELGNAVGGGRKSVTRAQLLLEVAAAGEKGVGMARLIRSVGICATAARAHLGALGRRDRWGRRGSGYIRSERGHYPALVYRLTPRGQRLIERLAKAWPT